VVSQSGELNRARLAERVFGDPAVRRRVEELTHPEVARVPFARAREHEAAGCSIVVYDAPLLVETGRYREMDVLVVVWAEDAARVARMVARSGLSPEDAWARIAAQLPQADKVRLADHVIDNSGSLDALAARFHDVLRALAGTEREGRRRR
jgi:dephospho-CoA kinase